MANNALLGLIAQGYDPAAKEAQINALQMQRNRLAEQPQDIAWEKQTRQMAMQEFQDRQATKGFTRAKETTDYLLKMLPFTNYNNHDKIKSFLETNGFPKDGIPPTSYFKDEGDYNVWKESMHGALMGKKDKMIVPAGSSVYDPGQGKEEYTAPAAPDKEAPHYTWNDIVDDKGNPTGKQQKVQIFRDGKVKIIEGVTQVKPSEVKPDPYQNFEKDYPEFAGKRGSSEKIKPHDGGKPVTYSEKFESVKALEVPKTNISVTGAVARGEAFEKVRGKDVFDVQSGDMVPVSQHDINQDMENSKKTGEPRRYLAGAAAERAKRQWTYMNEMGASVQDLRNSVTKMKPFGNVQLLELGKFLGTHKPGMLDTFATSKLFSGLSTDQQDFAIKLLQSKESAMGMRQVLGAGQGSDLVREAIDKTLPGILVGDKRVMLKQLESFDIFLERMKEGLINERAFKNIGKSGGYKGETTPTGGNKTITKKFYSPSTGKTKIVYSDGTEEIK